MICDYPFNVAYLNLLTLLLKYFKGKHVYFKNQFYLGYIYIYI
jgi:hypothetical protein